MDGSTQEDQKQDTGWYEKWIRREKWQYLHNKYNKWYRPVFSHG